MDYIRFGRTGMKVSRLCLGCMSYGDPTRGNYGWTLPEEASRPFIRRALDLGINFFDTANIYSDGTSEEYLGRGLSRKAIMAEIDASLVRLGVDYVDLYQIHRWDNGTPIEETLEALHDVVKAGKARYIGASSMYAWQFAKALAISERHGWSRFVSMQDYVNLLYREEEREMLPLCRDQGIAVIPWSPLARGRLTRAWDDASARQEDDEFGRSLYARTADADRQVVEAVARVAAARGVPRAQVALAWLLQQPGITAPIIGATREGHLEDAVAALSLALEPEEIAALQAPYVPHAVVGHA